MIKKQHEDDSMKRSEAEKAADYLLNELMSFADKPEDTKEKVTEWFEQNCSLDSADKLRINN